MVVLDAYALLAFVRDEPAAAAVERLLRTEATGVTSINYAEALDRLMRVARTSEARAQGTLDPLLGDVVARLDVDFAIARRAAMIRSRRHHHRAVHSPLPTASAWPPWGPRTRSRPPMRRCSPRLKPRASPRCRSSRAS